MAMAYKKQLDSADSLLRQTFYRTMTPDIGHVEVSDWSGQPPDAHRYRTRGISEIGDGKFTR